MLRDTIETTLDCRIVQWDEYDGEGNYMFSALQHGRLIVADSLNLLVRELTADRVVVLARAA